MEKKIVKNRRFIFILVLIIISSSTLPFFGININGGDKRLNKEYSNIRFASSSYLVNNTPFIVGRTQNPLTIDPVDS